MAEKALPKICLRPNAEGLFKIVLTEHWEFLALSRKQICTSLTRSLKEWFPSSRCDLAHCKALYTEKILPVQPNGELICPSPSPSTHPLSSRTPVKPIPVKSPQFPCSDKATPVPSISLMAYITGASLGYP